METAEQMGIKHSAPKQKCLPEECGMTVQSIGVAKASAARFTVIPMLGVSNQVSGQNLM